MAQRAEAQSKLQGAEAQLAVARAKADADRSTFDKIEGGLRDAGRRRRQRRGDRGEGGRRQPEPGAGRSAERRGRAPGAERRPRHGRVPARHGAVRRRRHRAQRASRRARRALERRRSCDAAAAPGRQQSAAPRRARARGLHRRDEDGRPRFRFRWPPIPDRRFSGKVARIAQAVDVSTRTMAVELDVANSDGRLAPGTFCQVRWPVRSVGAVAVRAERQRGDDDGPHVCDPHPRRQDGMGGRQDRTHVGTRWWRCSAICRRATKSPDAGPTNCVPARRCVRVTASPPRSDRWTAMQR